MSAISSIGSVPTIFLSCGSCAGEQVQYNQIPQCFNSVFTAQGKTENARPNMIHPVFSYQTLRAHDCRDPLICCITIRYIADSYPPLLQAEKHRYHQDYDACNDEESAGASIGNSPNRPFGKPKSGKNSLKFFTLSSQNESAICKQIISVVSSIAIAVCMPEMRMQSSVKQWINGV
ncbi:hypothetical protein HHL16_18470 [Pseudoflavitalea sp. G-6-1-2]|uniref:hypothetical protein n=1 Tax=Pseudoflavitalea sp. G-6-1-2 TaxID=2728841 RepID=UPI00146CF4DC|nr:hypothetical protein [Pseudoflavitalea sp. G-6-1-2]NML22870.1 hypothetical protein [Pseudoflavitalea sp. G-6-1-2]